MKRGMLEAPWLVPVPIETIGKPWYVRAIAPFRNRYFCLGDDFHYYDSEGELCMIPCAFMKDSTGAFVRTEDGLKVMKRNYFRTDCTSWPRPLRILFSKVGVGIVQGIVHDSIYALRAIIRADGTIKRDNMTRAEADREMYLIGLNVNGIKWLSNSSYAALRAFGGFAWQDHREAESERLLPLILADY